MAATTYAALVSLSKILKQILDHHPKLHWLSFDREQIISLEKKVCSLHYLLEDVSNRRVTFVTDELMNQMANAGHKAEDIIDLYVADSMRALESASSSEVEDGVTGLATHFRKNIERMTKLMDNMYQSLVKIKEEMDFEKDMNSSSLPYDDAESRRRAAPRSSSNVKDVDVMVGFDDHLVQMTGKLATDKPKLQIITIVGMAGIGKTTLAKNLYVSKFIVESYSPRAWVTISQTYTVRENLLALLYDLQNHNEKREVFNEKMSETNDEDLGQQLYQILCGRRYLIVLDDIWSTKPWVELRRFFPDNKHKSRIVITTRLSILANCLSSAGSHELQFLEEDKSWTLFCKKVFMRYGCPVELEGIGKRIVKSCKGLPLAIVAIGGLLANSSKTPEYWEHVAENVPKNVNSTINSEEATYSCLKILSLSYNDLPIHLKPCFLYMAMFPEDCEMKVTRLIKLWVAEGFLKPIKDMKNMEDVAMVYLKDLIDRNLILVSKRGRTGQIKTCRIHDVLRDLCLREAMKENFICAVRVENLDNSPELGIESKRRLAIHKSSTSEPLSYNTQVLINALQSASNARSLLCEVEGISPIIVPCLNLLRVLDVADKYYPEQITKLSSLRYVALDGLSKFIKPAWFIPSMFPHWNLQTFKRHDRFYRAVLLPPVIWEMTELRHLEMLMTTLPDPPESHDEGTQVCLLENLQTLLYVYNLKCSKEFVKRVPNMRKLKIHYEIFSKGVEWSHYSLNNLVLLRNLESITLTSFEEIISTTNIAFPHSLKTLKLNGTCLPWKDIIILSSLPELEHLWIKHYAFEGKKWDASEGEYAFVRLKFLRIDSHELKDWTADDTHFPMLEHLCLDCPKLENIPVSFAEIRMLQIIELHGWMLSVVPSTREISAQRDYLGYEDLQVFFSNIWGMNRIDAHELWTYFQS